MDAILSAAAIRCVRKMRGGAQAYLIEADDGHEYVVKFLNNPQGHRVLTNEFIASHLMKAMGLSTPEIANITFPDRPLDGDVQLSITNANGAEERPPPGVHFGSRHPGRSNTCAVYDFLADTMLPEVFNREEFLGALVFDKWLSNADSRQAIFYRARITGCDGFAHWVTQFIDNGLQFQGEDWCFRDSPVQGLYGRRTVYAGASTLRQFGYWFEALFALKRELIQDIFESVPAEWVVGERCELAKTMKLLFRRRERVLGLVAESLGQLERRVH